MLPWQEYIGVTLSLLSTSAQEYIHEHDIHYDSQLPSAFKKQTQPDNRKTSSLISGNQLIDESFDSSSSISSKLPPSTKSKGATSSGTSNPSTQNNSKIQANTSQTIRGYDDYNHFDDTDEDDDEIIHNKQNKSQNNSQINNSRIDDKNLRNQSHRHEQDDDEEYEEDYDPSLGHQVLSSNEFDSMPKRQLNTSYTNKDNERKNSKQTTSNQWNAVRTAPIRSSVGSMYSDDPSELGEEEDEDRDFTPSQHNRSYDSRAQQGLLLPDSDEEPDIQQMGNKSNNSIKWKKRVHLSHELQAQDLSQQQNTTHNNISQQEDGNSDEDEDQQHEIASDSEPSPPPKPVKKPANNTGSKFFSLTSIDHSAEDSMSAPNSPARDEEKPTMNVFKEDKPTLTTSSTQPLGITMSSEPKIPSSSSTTTVNTNDNNTNQPNALLQSVSLDSPVKTHINPPPMNNTHNNNTNSTNATTQGSKGSTGLSSLFGFNKKKKDSSSRDPSPQTNMNNNNNINNNTTTNMNTMNPPINATLTRSSSNEQLSTTDTKDKQPQKSNLFSTVKNVFQVKGMLSRHASPLTRTPSQEQLQQQSSQQPQQSAAFSLNSSSSHGIADQTNRPGRSLSIDSGSTNTSAIDHPSQNNNMMNKPINIPTQAPSHSTTNTQNNQPMKKTLSLSNMFLRRSRDQSDSSEPPSPLQLNPVDINPDPTKKKSLFSAPFRRSQENPIPTSQPPIQPQSQTLTQPQTKTFTQPQPIINSKQEIKIPMTQTVNSQPQSSIISNQSQPPQMIQVPQVVSQPPSKPVVTIKQPSESIPIKAKEPIVVQSYQPPPPIQQNQPKNASPLQTIQKQPSRDENVPGLPRRDSIFEPTEPLRQPLVIPADSRRSQSPPHRSQSMNELPRRDSIFEPSEPITDLNHLFNEPVLTSGQRTMSMNNIDPRTSRAGQPPLARQNTASSSLVQQSIPNNPRQSLRASSPQVLRHIQRENPKLNGRGLALLLRQHFQPNEEELIASSLTDAMVSSATNGPAASIKINRRSYQKLSSSTTLSHHSKTQKKLQKLLIKSQAINNEVLERQMGLVHVPKPPPRLVAPGLSQPIPEKENEKDNVKVLLLDQLLENPMNNSLLPKGLNFDERLLLEMNAIVHAKQHGKPPALSASQASSRLSYSVHHSKHYALKPLDPIPLSAVGDDLYSVDYDRNKEYLIKLFQQIKARDEPLQQRIFTSKDIEETRQLIKQCHEETKQPLHTYQTMKEQAKNSVLHDLRKQFQQKFQYFQEHGLHYSRLSSPYFLLDQQQRFPEEYSQLTNALHTASLASWRFPDSTETSLGIYFAGNLKKKLRSGWRQRYYAIMLDPIDNPNLPSSRKADPTTLTTLAATTGGLRFYLVEYSKCLDTIWGHVPYHFKRLFELSSLLSVVTNTKSNKGGKEFVLCFYVDPRGNNKPIKTPENNVVSSGIAETQDKESLQPTKDEKNKQFNEEEEKKKKEDDQKNQEEMLEEKQEINDQAQPKEKDEQEIVNTKEKPQEEKPIKPPKPQTTKGSIANSEDLDDDEDEDMEDDEGSVASSNAESIYFYRPGTLDHIPVKSRSPDALKDSLSSKKKQSKNWIKIGLKTESPDERLHWTKLLHALAPQAYVNTLQY